MQSQNARKCPSCWQILRLLTSHLDDVLMWKRGRRSRHIAHEGTVWLAHRGLHDADLNIPENSLAAVRHAVAEGFGVEIDVQLSRDGVPVVFHDDDLVRMTRGRDNRRVRDMTAAELAQVRLEDTDETIPTLADVLDIVVPLKGPRYPIMIEIKNFSFCVGPLERAIADVIEEREAQADPDWIRFVAAAAFNPLVLCWFVQHAPQVGRILIGGSFASVERGWVRLMRPLLKRLLLIRWAQPDLIAWELGDLPRRRVQQMRAAGMSVLAWTVHSDEERREACRWADGCIYEEPVRPAE